MLGTDIASFYEKMTNYVNSLDNPCHKCHFDFVEILGEKTVSLRKEIHESVLYWCYMATSALGKTSFAAHTIKVLYTSTCYCLS